MKEYIYNVSITLLLILGGFAVSALITPSEKLYPVITFLCIIPASLFIKRRLGQSWSDFIKSILCIIVILITLSIIDYFEPTPVARSLYIGIIVYVYFAAIRKVKKSRTKRSTE